MSTSLLVEEVLFLINFVPSSDKQNFAVWPDFLQYVQNRVNSCFILGLFGS